MTQPALSQSDHLRILVFGAGALGTYIGGSLALNGHPVAFIERPQFVPELLQRGLCLNLSGQEHHIPKPTIFSSIPEVLSAGPFDLAIFALKSYDTQNAVKGFAPYAAQLPTFLCLQNGVENEATLETVLGAGRVIAGSVTSAIGRRAVGDIFVNRERGIGIGGGHVLSERLVNALRQAGLNARLYPNPMDMKWSKMFTNLPANASSAILNMTAAEIFAHAGLYRLEITQLREALAVMAHQGISVVDLPGTPVRALAAAIRWLPAILSQPILKNAIGGGRGGKMPSFHIDLHSGSGNSEVNYLNGAVVRGGQNLGIPTPANRLLTETLLALTCSEQPIDFYSRQPEKLLRRFSQYTG